jgi:lipid II:glycine glycyltransferase (peptidoglycan interpeptide bridge formation enzyme)
MKDFPNGKIMSGTSLGSMTLLNARASVWSPDDESLSIEDRMARIIRNQERLKEDLERVESDNLNQKNKFTGRIENLEEKLHSEINQVNSKLESIHMEDFIWALTGLLFILFGTLFTTFASQLAS